MGTSRTLSKWHFLLPEICSGYGGNGIYQYQEAKEVEMKKIERVMICVDFSDYSQETIEYTLALTRGMKTEILLLNVINRRDIDMIQAVIPYFPPPFSMESHKERLLTERHERFRTLIGDLASTERLRIKTQVTIGIPFEAIEQAIASENVDLVVTGNKGRSNIAGTLFGSNAEKVFRHSPVPVLSVRNRQRFGRKSISPVEFDSAKPLAEIKKILVAVDFSIYSQDVLKYATELATSTAAELVAVNVINKRLIESMERAFNNENPDTFSRDKFLHDETSKRTLNLSDLMNKTVVGEIATRTVIADGVPFEEIMKVVDEEQADLLVINSKGRTNLAEYLFGTTAEKVFRHSSASVLSLNLKRQQ